MDHQKALQTVSRNGFKLENVSEEFKDNKEIVMAACSHKGYALRYASKELQSNREVVLAACSNNGAALEFASAALQSDKEIVLAACSTNGYYALEYASEELQNDKDVVLAACHEDGWALQWASESLRADKDVVMAAIASNPESAKYGLGGLNQDKDCLIMAGLWDVDYIAERESIDNIKKNVLSTRFSLAAESSPHATEFTLELKKHPHIVCGGNFLVYSPNAFSKETCDPNWTNQKWPCRGTYGSCQKPPHLKSGVPQEHECCWRYSFRYQLEEAHRFGGFMVQVVDFNFRALEHRLGDGQRIETEMAQDVGIKIFRYFESTVKGSTCEAVNELVHKIYKWYKDGCSDMEICKVSLGEEDSMVRPFHTARLEMLTR